MNEFGLAWIFWDPSRVLVTLFGFTIYWYGACWAVGFSIALLLSFQVMQRFFCYYPTFTDEDVLDRDSVRVYLQKKHGLVGENVTALLNGLLLTKEKKAPREITSSRLLRFARKRLAKDQMQMLENRLYLEKKLRTCVRPLFIRARELAETGWAFVLVGTLIGARLGHLFFYRSLESLLADPLIFFNFREGGMASHGATVGIVLSLAGYTFWKSRTYPMLSLLRILDIGTIPVLFGCAMIRIGNFFNQELLGVQTSMPWGVLFGSPEDGGLPIPRHPVQLYEASVYLLLMVVLYRVFYLQRKLLSEGVATGILFVVVFGFRFLVEFLKEQQGVYDPHLPLHMGQFLSVPFVVAGIYLIGRMRKEIRRDRLLLLGS